MKVCVVFVVVQFAALSISMQGCGSGATFDDQVDGQELEGRQTQTQSTDGRTRIICPFLSTMFHQKVLPFRRKYTAEELADLTQAAGLGRGNAARHIEAALERVGQRQFDIFSMEGWPNEHLKSTGISDCASDFSDCQVSQSVNHPFPGVVICETEQCTRPNEDKFDFFFNFFDADGDGALTADELANKEAEFTEHSVDRNDLGADTMRVSFVGLMVIFIGELRIEKADLRTLVIDAAFPPSFRGFGLTPCDGHTHAVPVPRLFADGSSGQFGIKKLNSNRWLTNRVPGNARTGRVRLIQADPAERPKHSMWTATLRSDNLWEFRSSVRGFILGQHKTNPEKVTVYPEDSKQRNTDLTLWRLDQVDLQSSRLRINNRFLRQVPGTDSSIFMELCQGTGCGTVFQFIVCDFLTR